MAEAIQKVPAGLLRYFGIQNGGQNPQALARFIQGTWDLQPLYENLDEEVAQTTVGVAAGGVLGDFAFGTLQVPDDEYWLVRQLEIRANMPVGVTNVNMVPAVQVPTKGQFGGAALRASFSVGIPYKQQLGVATVNVTIISAPSWQFWAPPASILGGITLALDPVATAISAFANVRFIRYKYR